MNLNYKKVINIFILLFCANIFATTYYISSNNGNDSNLGTNINQPWQTLNKVNTFNFEPGDSILFKRNEIWRGQLIPKSGNSLENIYYGAYSNGELPTILGSLSFSNNTDWTNVNDNIWRCNSLFLTDIGNIIFNNVITGLKKWNLSDLQNQNDFWYNLATGELFVYSISNPANIYSEIELALRKDIVNQQNTSFVTYENLSIKYGGAHGFGGGNTSNITIKSCEISYIGGGDLNMDSTIRFGNGIEFWGNASNNTVEKCKIWEIYDTGVTNQNHTITAIQQNIKYQNNIIWNCGLSSFEYWNRPETSTTSNIYFENNTCLYAGSGWGNQRPDYHGIHILLDNNTAETDLISIKNNILFKAQRSIYAAEDNVNGNFNINYNLVYQQEASDTLYVSFPSMITYTYSNFIDYTTNTNKDINSLTGEPGFIDILNFNFKLESNSQAIDSGTTVNVLDDFDGNQRPINELFDIGAYEYSEELNINEIEEKNQIKIYPNPTNKTLYIIQY